MSIQWFGVHTSLIAIDCQVRQQKWKPNQLEGFSFRQLAALTAWKESINRMDLDMLWTFNNIEWFPHVSEDVLVLELLSSHKKVVERQLKLPSCCAERHFWSPSFHHELGPMGPQGTQMLVWPWTYKSCLDRFSGKVCSQMLSTTTAIDNRWCPFLEVKGSWILGCSKVISLLEILKEGSNPWICRTDF